MVVVFDEIGLAEISPHNPLKVMHSLLEPPRVATVGISNWSLDASKQNRVITLSRTEPSEKDLNQSASEISNKSSDVFKKQYLDTLVKWYLSYMNKQQVSSRHKNFHGLRDFYSMIKYISKRITKNDPVVNEQIVLQGVKRNFGGTTFETAARALE